MLKRPLEVDDFGEYIVHTKKSGQRIKKYKAKCDNCGADRGFQPKSKLYRKCRACIYLDSSYRDKLQKAIKSTRSTYESRRKTIDQMARLRNELHSDPNYKINLKIRNNIRSRVSHAMAGRKKWGSSVDSLGCSIEELKRHLESQFVEGMSWDNYGEWEIDHIEPLSKFDLAVDSDFNRACNYKNLQPMWRSENRKKGASDGY